MKRKAFKKVTAVVLVGALAAGLTVSASAADGYFDAPTSEMEVDASYATAAVHRAASVLPEILGLSTVSGFSTINGGMPTDLAGAQSTLMLGAFGTNMNDNPDPFYYNLFYNFYAQENGLEPSQHAMLNDNNVSASPGGADTTIIDGYGTSISLAGRPDMLIGCSGNGDDVSGYDALIEDIRSGAIGEDYYQEGDENYDPYLVAYTFTYTYDMVVVANTVAYLMDNYLSDEEVMGEGNAKYGRYGIEVLGENGKTAMDIAQDLGDYVNGISTYVLSEIANGGVQKKTSAVISSIDATAGTITLANSDSQSATSNNRIAEYCELVTDNIANTSLGTSVTVPEMMDNADAIVFSGGNMSTLLTAIQNYDSANGTNYEDQLDEKVIIQNYPNSVYGITMNSIENCMGFGYFVGYLYCDVLPVINPVYMTAYFYQNFYHVSNLAYVEDILNVTCQDVDLPTDVTTDLTNYDADAIYNALQQGKDYYYDNFSDFSATALAEIWQADREAGIELGEEGTAWKKFDPVQELADEIVTAEALVSDLNPDDYTTGSWTALENAIAAAQALFESEDTAEVDYYNALTALKDAEDGMVYITDLKDAITSAQEQMDSLNEEDYTVASWSALEEAIASAQTIVGREDPSQREVDNAQNDLEDACANLALKATEEQKSDLQDAVDAANALDEALYTEDSWEELKEAVENAQAVLDNDDASADETEAAQEAVKTAMDNLEEKLQGLNKVDGVWGYYVNGEVDTSYTGFASNDNGDWYVKDGYIKFDQNGVFKDSTGVLGTAGTWYYVVGNAVKYSDTGLANYPNDNGWWYIKDGKVDFSASGVYKNKNGWWYVKNGKVDFSANTVAKNSNGWWYILGGKVQFNFTGLANYSNSYGWWYINKGKVNFNANTVAKNKNGWWYVTGGKVNFNYTGVANYRNSYGWWYIKNGKVDFTYNGTGTNKNGTWNVRNGKVVF